MIDFNHLGLPDEGLTTFIATGNANDWQVWEKPRNCQWVWMLAFGSGAGGGAGALNNSGQAGGGGGGGTGSIMRVLWPAIALPDRLFLRIGQGGLGGVGGNGSAGGFTYIARYPDTNAAIARLTFVFSGNPGLAGSTGAGGAFGAGASAVSALERATALNLSGAFWVSSGAGLPGIAGTIGGAGGNVFTNNMALVTGGAGGAGLPATPAAVSGGSISSNNGSPEGRVGQPYNNGGAGSAVASGTQGDAGLSLPLRRYTGGAGGGNAFGASTIGGAGANGGHGCGGGGGGGCRGGTSGGRGGNGGGSIVYIWAF